MRIEFKIELWLSFSARSGLRLGGLMELRRLKQLEEENATLKRLVADLSLDKHTP